LKQPLAAGCLRTRAPVRQAPCRRTAPPRPIRAWGRPRQPAVPRPGHVPSSRTLNPARAACRPALAPPRTTQARYTTWRCRGRRPRLGGLSRHPYLVLIVSQAQCQKNRKSTSRRVLSGERRCRPEPDRGPLLFSGRLCSPSLLPLERRLISLNPTASLPGRTGAGCRQPQREVQGRRAASARPLRPQAVRDPKSACEGANRP
jgi:hypothetical protein